VAGDEAKTVSGGATQVHIAEQRAGPAARGKSPDDVSGDQISRDPADEQADGKSPTASDRSGQHRNRNDNEVS
jgi:hypothetical protein